MKVPFANLTQMHEEIKSDILIKIEEIIDSSRFIGGNDLDTFEKDFASFSDSRYCIGISNGTEALVVALKVLNIGHGDTVLTVPNTFIATAEAISFVGANVEFIDVEENHFTMSPDLLKKYLETHDISKVKAIMPVHLYGQMADMNKIKEIADDYNLKIIEDTAQAHGARLSGKQPGQWSSFASYSFYPGKNLGAFGDAGALTTDDDDLHIKARRFKDHGRFGEKYIHSDIGINGRMDNLQAGILRIKLKHLPDWTEKRIDIADYYTEQLQHNSNIITPALRTDARHVYHLYVIRIKNRESVMDKLKNDGISTGLHYPVPLHLQPAYKHLGFKEGTFPVSEKLAGEILSLPLWPMMEKEQTQYVIDKLNEYC